MKKPKTSRISPEPHFVNLHIMVSPEFHNLIRDLSKKKKQHGGYIVEKHLTKYFNELLKDK